MQSSLITKFTFPLDFRQMKRHTIISYFSFNVRETLFNFKIFYNLRIKLYYFEVNKKKQKKENDSSLMTCDSYIKSKAGAEVIVKNYQAEVKQWKIVCSTYSIL